MPGLVSILDAGTNVEWHPIMQPMQCLSMDYGTLTFLSFVESLLLLLVTYSWDGRTGQMEKEGKRDIGTGRQAGMGSKVRGGPGTSSSSSPTPTLNVFHTKRSGTPTHRTRQ